MPDLPPGPTATPPHLPARLPQTTALLRRAQGTLEVLMLPDTIAKAQ